MGGVGVECGTLGGGGGLVSGGGFGWVGKRRGGREEGRGKGNEQ